MCDYSLEFYASRQAQEGETLTTKRFPSGSMGLTDAKDPTCAVCVSYGTKLTLDNLPPELLEEINLDSSSQKVTFVRIEEGLHHDGVKFSTGRSVLLHRLGVGVSVTFDKVESYGMGSAIRPLPPEIVGTLTASDAEAAALIDPEPAAQARARAKAPQLS